MDIMARRMAAGRQAGRWTGRQAGMLLAEGLCMIHKLVLERSNWE